MKKTYLTIYVLGFLAFFSGIPLLHAETYTLKSNSLLAEKINIETSCSLTLTTSSTPASCYGGNNGSATVTAGGGTAPYTYSWSPSGGTNSNATGLTAGTYTVTVTDKVGCTGTATVVVTQPSQLVVTVTANSYNICHASNNGSGHATASGGTPGYTYSWSNGSTKATTTNLGPGIYTVVVTDANGCTSSAILNISALTPITA